MTLKNNRAPLLSIIKLYASFHHHMWIQTGVTVRKRLSWVVTLTFDLWYWPFAWTSFLSLVITPENFMMIRWWEHSQKGVTDGQTDRRTDGRTDRQTDWTIHRAAWSQLKYHPCSCQHFKLLYFFPFRLVSFKPGGQICVSMFHSLPPELLVLLTPPIHRLICGDSFWAWSEAEIISSPEKWQLFKKYNHPIHYVYWDEHYSWRRINSLFIMLWRELTTDNLAQYCLLSVSHQSPKLAWKLFI